MESINSFFMAAFGLVQQYLISILVFIIAFLVGIIFFFIFSKPKVKKIDVNFLDDIAFENDAAALSNMVIQRVIKDYKFSSYSYMFINSAEVDFSIYLSEKVPDAYIDDVKRKIFDSLIESGIDPAVENKKVNLRKDGQPTDNNSRKALIDSFQVPILVNDILIGVFCFGSTSYLSESKNSILDIYEGVRRKFSDFSKYLGELQEDKDRFED
ncbi:hypothetical protein EBU94_02605, partial [bacterium]|nr:hypothetical protein [bacterium]